VDDRNARGAHWRTSILMERNRTEYQLGYCGCTYLGTFIPTSYSINSSSPGYMQKSENLSVCLLQSMSARFPSVLPALSDDDRVFIGSLFPYDKSALTGIA
jgi:hypothetical protein